MTDYLEALTKIGLYVGLLLLIGSSAAFWLARSVSLPDDVARPSPWMIASCAASAVIVFLLLRLVAHTWLTFGSDGSMVDNLQVIAMRSRWSGGWQPQLLVAAVALPAAWLARRGGVVPAAVASALAMTLAWSFTRLGHSAASGLTGAAATAHMIGGGIWLGTLTVLVLTRKEGRVWSGFSALALTGAAIVVLSGLILASTFLTSWRDLFESEYGRLFVVKMACFAGILGCGFLNWRQVRQASGLNVRPANAGIEVTLAAVLIVVTAFLTEIGHP